MLAHRRHNKLRLAFRYARCRKTESPDSERLLILFTKGRILCTEDDTDTRDLIDYVLTGYGFDVVCTRSTDEAIKLAKSQHFDLYLVDNWMPGLSGTALTEKLRQFDIKTPVLFYSGAAYEADKEAARLSGAQGYLVKPADGDQLIAEVVRIIAESTIAIPVEIVAAHHA